MNKPSVSVILPVYNRPGVVIRAIASVLDQSFSDFELVIVDDGSTPPLTLPDEICADDRVKIVHLEQNQGPSAARNAGAKAARGQWLAWLDSDDSWHVDKLAKQMQYLQKLNRPDAMIALATGFEYHHPTGKREKRIPLPASTPLPFFSGCWYCPGTTLILSAVSFAKVGEFDEDILRLEDIDWFARFALLGGHLEVVPDVLVDINTRGAKAPYEKVRKAGAYLLTKFQGEDWDLPPGARNHLSAYLQIEYAASAMSCDHNYFRGLGHLAASWLRRPRARLHLQKFWR